MKKCYSSIIWTAVVLSILSGCQEGRDNYKVDEEKVVKETMNSSVYIDPAIELSSAEIISIIVEFKTKPANIAVIEAEAKGIPLTLEEAKKAVEESHKAFQQELELILNKNQVPYTIRHTYTSALNGVSMELPTNQIKRLAESSSVISKIYLNKKIQLQPPISPSGQI